METSRFKEIIILLVVLALIGGFILFMRNQSIKRELQEKKDKMEMAARRQAEEREREERKLAEKREREERKLAKEKEEEERRLAEEKEREERRQAEKKALERKAELRKYEADVREKRRRIALLKQKLDDIVRNPSAFAGTSQTVADEIAEVDNMLTDDMYKCFDFCINFRHIKFERSMRHDREEPDLRGYYTVLNRGARGRRVQVSYHCNEHDITWTKIKADRYRQKYIPSARLEEKKKRLTASLEQIRRSERSMRAKEIAKLKAEIAAEEKELAEMEKAQPVGD